MNLLYLKLWNIFNDVGYVKKNLLNGLDISDFRVMEPVAKQWLDNIAKVRVHGEIGKCPVDMFKKELPLLSKLPATPYDTGQVSQVRASKQYRIRITQQLFWHKKKAADQAVHMKFLTLSNKAQEYYQQLGKRLNRSK